MLFVLVLIFVYLQVDYKYNVALQSFVYKSFVFFYLNFLVLVFHKLFFF